MSLIGAASAAQPQVLILRGAGALTAGEMFMHGIETSLDRAPGGVSVFTELYDAERFPTAEHDAALVKFLREKYAKHHIDLVIAFGPAQLAFLSRYGDTLFPNAPVVFVGVRASRLATMVLPPTTTGITGHFDVAATLELAHALQPEARRVVFISGMAPLDVAWRDPSGARRRARRSVWAPSEGPPRRIRLRGPTLAG